MKNFLKFPCKVIFQVSLEQFAQLRSADAVRRPKHCSTLTEDSPSLPLEGIPLTESTRGLHTSVRIRWLNTECHSAYTATWWIDLEWCSAYTESKQNEALRSLRWQNYEEKITILCSFRYVDAKMGSKIDLKTVHLWLVIYFMLILRGRFCLEVGLGFRGPGGGGEGLEAVPASHIITHI